MNKMGRRVLLVGGSEEYTGALYLAGVSALRAGAESVIVMAPEKAAWALNALSPDLITRKLRGKFLGLSHKTAIMRQLKTADVLLMGNGASTRPSTLALMRFLSKWPGPKVIDADALKALRDNRASNAILTPNSGEWTLLQRNNDIKKLLSQNIVIIKKGMPTEILSQTKTFHQRRTNRGLEKAGTGDVLAGLCAGFLASPPEPWRRRVQGRLLWQSAKKATSIGNSIADLLTKKKKGFVYLASDLAQELKRICK